MTTKIIAHRGLSSQYPENTMLAFQNAVKLGCDGIELDVQLSRDGIPMVIHDETLFRTTGRRGFVKDYTCAELQTFDAGYGFDAQQGVCRIPTLEEYCDFIKGEEILTDIELKNGIFSYEGMEEKVIDLVLSHHLEDRVQFSSFNHQSMYLCKQLLPKVRCGLLTSDWLVGAGDYVRRCGADDLNPQYLFLTAENIEELMQHDVGIFAWTVDDKDAAQRLISYGISAVITNHPEFLLPHTKNVACG